jgi:hypothetical protein
MNKEIKESYNLFSIEVIENILTEMKENEFDDLQNFLPHSRKDLEYYLDLRKGVLFIE